MSIYWCGWIDLLMKTKESLLYVCTVPFWCKHNVPLFSLFNLIQLMYRAYLKYPRYIIGLSPHWPSIPVTVFLPIQDSTVAVVYFLLYYLKRFSWKTFFIVSNSSLLILVWKQLPIVNLKEPSSFLWLRVKDTKD